jgi:hypothetical protein
MFQTNVAILIIARTNNHPAIAATRLLRVAWVATNASVADKKMTMA